LKNDVKRKITFFAHVTDAPKSPHIIVEEDFSLLHVDQLRRSPHVHAPHLTFALLPL